MQRSRLSNGRAKIILFALFFLPSISSAKEPNIVDVLEGRAKSNNAILEKKSYKKLSRNAQTKQQIARAIKQYPEIERLHDNVIKESEEENGTDIALKRLAAEFERQFLKLMWQYASAGVGSEDNFAQSTWHSQWRESIIDEGTEMGDIGMAVYEELKVKNSKKPNIRRK